jgi:hypothetical protein
MATALLSLKPYILLRKEYLQWHKTCEELHLPRACGRSGVERTGVKEHHSAVIHSYKCRTAAEAAVTTQLNVLRFFLQFFFD